MLDLSEVCSVLNPTCSLRGPVAGISTDSRTLKPGELFFAIAGPKFDGHEYVSAAMERGACAAVVSERRKSKGPVIPVRDPRAALGALAAVYRRNLPARVIAVTGSNGKTTTKDMIAHILSKSFRVVRAEKSFNNDIGVPLTLLRARADDQFVVLEIGTNRPGEILALGRIAMPGTAVITSISEAHLEGFKTVEAIADEKFSLLRCLEGDGLAVLNADNDWIYERLTRIKQRKKTVGAIREADVMATSTRVAAGEVSFTLGDVPFTLRMMGRWNVLNALAAVVVGTESGLSVRDCARALEDFQTPSMRMEKIVRGEVTFICDAYNANPVSMRNALQEVSDMAWAGRKVAVIGDMLELGDASVRLHRELGEWLARIPSIRQVIFIGKDARHAHEAVRDAKESWYFATVEQAGGRAGELLRPGDLVLLKGSRGMALERFIDRKGK